MSKYCENCGQLLEEPKAKQKYCIKCSRGRGGRQKPKSKKVKKTVFIKKNYGDDSQCKTCRFGGHMGDVSVLCCDYYYMTGKMRNCEPSPHCEKYEKGKRESTNPLPFTIKG